MKFLLYVSSPGYILICQGDGFDHFFKFKYVYKGSCLFRIPAIVDCQYVINAWISNKICMHIRSATAGHHSTMLLPDETLMPKDG